MEKTKTKKRTKSRARRTDNLNHGQAFVQVSDISELAGLNFSPDTTILINLRNAKIADVNNTFVNRFGYNRSEVINKSMKELKIWFSPSESARLFLLLKNPKSNSDVHAQLCNRAGENIIGLISTRYIQIEDQKYVLCFIRDITLEEQQHDKITGELKKSTKLFGAIFNSIPDIIGLQDKNHYIIRYNEAGYKMLNLTPEQVRGKRCFELIGRNVACSKCATTETYKTKKPAQTQKYVPQTDTWFDVRSYPILNENNEIDLVIEHLRDITAERKASESRNQTAERLELALKGADLGMWDWNREKNEITHSQRWCTMLGYDENDINSDFAAWKSLVYPDDYQMVIDTLQDHLDGKSEIYESEYRLKSKSGDWLWVLDRGKIVERDSSGKVLRMTGTHLDITNRKKDQEENKKLLEQLNQARKMEAVGTLAGGIAHDFNNLLTAINGFSEIAQMKLEDNHPANKDIISILEAGHRAEALTRQLLAFSRKQVIEPKILDLNQVIINLDKMLRRLIGEDLKIKMLLDDTIPSIKADPGQLEQILINLFINSRDAINQHTKPAAKKIITVETGFRDLSEEYQSKNIYSKTGPHLVIRISDTGVGMDREVQEKVFEPFFTTKERARGTGLGLSTVYCIVKQNQGHINIYSEPKIGTTIKIYWPATEEKQEKTVVEKSSKKSLKGSETLLLVEDDAAVRDFALKALESYGYRIMIATDGKDALNILNKNCSPKFTLLVTDLIMPEMNGQELAEAFTSKFKHGQVLFTSGYPENHMVHNGFLESGINFLHKPYSRKELAAKVRAILDN